MMTGRIASRVLGLLADRRGAVSVEICLTLSAILVPLMLGSTDAELMLATQDRVDQAIRGAALYGWISGSNATVNGLKSAAQSAFGTSTLTTNSQSIVCYCVSTLGIRSASTVSCASGTCPSGSSLGTFIQSQVAYQAHLPFTLGWLGVSGLASASGLYRIN